MKKDTLSIINKKARFNYFIEDEYIAGIVLTGSEIKSIRKRNVSISDSFCEFNDNDELFINKMYIKEYQNSNYNRNSLSQRKLLLNRKELKKLKKRVKQMEAQRERNRSWNHKAELLEMKKQKLKMKEMLRHIEENTLSTPLSEYEAIEKWLEENEG